MRYEFLDLPVWEDDELADALGESPLKREKLHHWPLSYVERVDFSDRSLVVKYTKLSMENAFYSASSASFLIQPVLMTECGDTSITVLPFIRGREPQLHEIPPVLEQIHRSAFDTLWLDCSTHTCFMDAMRESAGLLQKHDPAASVSAFLEKCTSFEPYFAPECTGFIHGDLKPDNILVTDEKAIVIDWQRPMKAPFVIDEVTSGCTKEDTPIRLAKALETYWLLYAFDKCLYKLPHVLNWAKKNIADML